MKNCLGAEVSSNLVSFLTHRQIVKEDSSLRKLSYILIIITVINLVLTYTLIHLYLNFKHSRAINIAERSQFNFQESFLSFKKLLVGFAFLSLCGIFNFCVYESNLYQNIDHVPPITLMINFVTVFVSLIFVFKKKKVLAFMERRWRASNINFEPLNTPLNMKKYSNKVVPVT